jgi:hypothetical protein
VKPPKSKQKKPNPFGAHFTHPHFTHPHTNLSHTQQSLPQKSLPQHSLPSSSSIVVKTEPDHEHSPVKYDILQLTPEKPFGLRKITDTTQKQSFSEFVFSQLQAVTQQKEMYERLLSRHIDRLQQKEKMLSDMLKDPNLSENNYQKSTEDPEQMFRSEIRKLYEEFDENKDSTDSTPSSPSSELSRSTSDRDTSDHETCSESEGDEPEDTSKAWPDPQTCQWPPSTETKNPTPPSEGWSNPADLIPTLPSIPTHDIATHDTDLPNFPQMKLPLQEAIGRSISASSDPDFFQGISGISRGISGSIATDVNSVNNWASLLIAS